MEAALLKLLRKSAGIPSLSLSSVTAQMLLLAGYPVLGTDDRSLV